MLVWLLLCAVLGLCHAGKVQLQYDLSTVTLHTTDIEGITRNTSYLVAHVFEHTLEQTRLRSKLEMLLTNSTDPSRLRTLANGVLTCQNVTFASKISLNSVTDLEASWEPVLLTKETTDLFQQMGSVGLLFLHDPSQHTNLIEEGRIVLTRWHDKPPTARDVEAALFSGPCTVTKAGAQIPVQFQRINWQQQAQSQGSDWLSFVHSAAHAARHTRRLSHIQHHHDHEFLHFTHPHETLNSFLVLDETYVDQQLQPVTAESGSHTMGRQYFRDIAESITLNKREISQSFGAMLCRTGQTKHLANLHHDIGEQAKLFLKEVMSLKIISVIAAMIKGFIIDPIIGGLVRGLMDILVDIFMLSVVASVVAQLSGPMKQQLENSAGTMINSALPAIVAMLLSGSLGVRLIKCLVGSLAYHINSFLDAEAATGIAGGIIHTLSHTITNSVTTSLNFGLTETLTHTLSASLSNSVTHYFYCTYCYYFGDYCNFCYYYQDFKWLHKQNWEGFKPTPPKRELEPQGDVVGEVAQLLGDETQPTKKPGTQPEVPGKKVVQETAVQNQSGVSESTAGKTQPVVVENASGGTKLI